MLTLAQEEAEETGDRPRQAERLTTQAEEEAAELVAGADRGG